MQGVTKQQVRWQKCVDFVNERLGMAVGRLFIRENFQKESKETVTFEFSVVLKELVPYTCAYSELMFELLHA